MSSTKRLSLGSMIISIIAVLTFVPWLGYIPIGPVQITIVHIPVLVAAIALNDRGMAAVAGLSFGISSFLVAIIRPLVITAPLFQNPLVSILPRLIFALVAYYLYQFLKKRISNRYVAVGLTAGISTLLHTLLVLSMMYLFGSDLFPEGLVLMILGVVQTNGWIELIIAVLIVPPIVIAVQNALKLK